MTTPLPPPVLTPLESAILRAVVEMGKDKADVSALTQSVAPIVGRSLGLREMHAALSRLEAEGFVCRYSPKYERWGKRCWRPACDLTEILK